MLRGTFCCVQHRRRASVFEGLIFLPSLPDTLVRGKKAGPVGPACPTVELEELAQKLVLGEKIASILQSLLLKSAQQSMDFSCFH